MAEADIAAKAEQLKGATALALWLSVIPLLSRSGSRQWVRRLDIPWC